MAFAMSSGERFSSNLAPRQITRYSEAVAGVLIGLFMVAGSLSSNRFKRPSLATYLPRLGDGARARYGQPSRNSTMTELDEDEQFYRDTESIAFPKLDDRQLAMLEPLGARRIVRRGELLFKAGQRDLGLMVVLRGELDVFESRDGQEQILGTSGPRGFIGDVAMLMGTAALANTRGKADESEILEVPADRLRQALVELPGVSETIVRAFRGRCRRRQLGGPGCDVSLRKRGESAAGDP